VPGINRIRDRQIAILASELPPQHHVVEFGLTHKVNFSYTFSAKSDFLSKKVAVRINALFV
jgi:hypothetical protein